MTKGDAEMIGYLKRLAGMTLIGDKGSGVFVVMTGEGGNGKTVFLDTVAGVMGDYALRAFPVDAITGRRSGPDEKFSALLFGRRLVVSSESNQEVALNAAAIKAYTDETKQRGRWLYKNSFEFNTTHTLWFMSNHLPVVDDTSDGMWRRMRVLDFKNKIREAQGSDKALPLSEQIANGIKNELLASRLIESEGPGILNWLVEGAHEYMRDKLRDPEFGADSGDFRVESDPMKDFVDEWIEFGAGEYITRADLQQRTRSGAPRTRSTHKQRLKPRGLVEEMRRRCEGGRGIPFDKNARIGTEGGMRAITGIGLKRPVRLGEGWS
jgi:putative DNA primase/helicase